jgi:FixJ family two-component response regulator
VRVKLIYILTEIVAILRVFAAFVVRLWSDLRRVECMPALAVRDEEYVTEAKPIIIAIDDDPSILRALRRVVSGAGFEIQTFDRPSAVLKSDLPKAGACLIVDIDLPEMNGVELCTKLATSGCVLPVILITAHTDEATQRLADGVHPIALLIKPFERELLVSSIESALLAGEN